MVFVSNITIVYFGIGEPVRTNCGVLFPHPISLWLWGSNEMKPLSISQSETSSGVGFACSPTDVVFVLWRDAKNGNYDEPRFLELGQASLGAIDRYVNADLDYIGRLRLRSERGSEIDE